MEPADLLSTVRTSNGVLVAALRAAGTDATVPTCPGWGTTHLAAHVAGVYRYVTGVVRSGTRPERGRTDPEPPEGERAFAEMEVAGDELVATLEATAPDAPAWNWSTEPQTAAFYFRRMAHESVVHAADALSITGAKPSPDAAVAADGIDELLTVLLPNRHRLRPLSGLDALGSLHVHCTDVDGEWLVRCDGTGLDVRREHAKGDAALRGPAADLLLHLYNRGGGGEVVGDASVMARWRDAVKL